MFCPITKEDCQCKYCAWYEKEKKCCCIKYISEKMVGQESVEIIDMNTAKRRIEELKERLNSIED